MIDLFHDEVLTLSDAAKRLPNHPHPGTLWRWGLRGIRGVRLETIKIGGCLHTSLEALQRFAEACTGANVVAPTTMTRDWRKQVEEGEAELRSAGIL